MRSPERTSPCSSGVQKVRLRKTTRSQDGLAPLGGTRKR
jgi:hypothetical protein